MAQEEPSRFAEWLLIIRRQLPVVRRHLDDWWEQIREEPTLIWETPAVRYTTYGLAALILLWGVSSIPRMVHPPIPASAKPAATTADFHVICSSGQCGHHFLIHRKFGFDRFPVACPKCGQETGGRALRCNRPTCRGRWVLPRQVGAMLTCPYCGDALNATARTGP